MTEIELTYLNGETETIVSPANVHELKRLLEWSRTNHHDFVTFPNAHQPDGNADLYNLNQIRHLHFRTLEVNAS